MRRFQRAHDNESFGRSARAGVLVLMISVAGCASNRANPPATQAVSMRAEDTQPLQIGQKAPAAVLPTPSGEPLDLRRAYRQQPTMLIFYRGGWCPYCNTHLGQIAEAEPKLIDLGLQILAVSADRPEELQKSIDKEHVTYQLLSDSDMKLAQQFGVAFRVDDETIEKYRGFGIDLEHSSGQSHHILPVPAVFIIDQNGVIRFSHWSPDYKTRLSAAELIGAAQKTVGTK